MYFKKIVQCQVLIICLALIWCSEPISFEINEGIKKESSIPYNLSPLQLKHVEQLYIAIRDKDVEQIQQITDENLYRELLEHPTLLPEISAYIPYYEKLLDHKMLEYKSVKHSRAGELIEAKYKYEYEQRTVFYTVLFRKDDPLAKIIGAHLKLVTK